MLYLAAPEDLHELLPDQPSYRADQLRSWLYATPVLEAASMSKPPTDTQIKDFSTLPCWLARYGITRMIPPAVA